MPKYNRKYLAEIKAFYSLKKKDIAARIEEFSRLWRDKKHSDIFAELVFCHLTPQSSAKTCWKAVTNLREKNLVFKGPLDKIRREISNVRFKNNKARYITRTQKLLPPRELIKLLDRLHTDVFGLREWLVENIKGMGYKEASHFLRNIGLGENLAILDRHILKNLKLLGVIKEVSKAITKKNYLAIEDKMKEFARNTRIPLSHLDLLFWSKQTGEIFK